MLWSSFWYVFLKVQFFFSFEAVEAKMDVIFNVGVARNKKKKWLHWLFLFLVLCFLMQLLVGRNAWVLQLRVVLCNGISVCHFHVSFFLGDILALWWTGEAGCGGSSRLRRAQARRRVQGRFLLILRDSPMIRYIDFIADACLLILATGMLAEPL